MPENGRISGRFGGGERVLAVNDPAALIFDDLDMPVLLSIVDRMREAKAAPVMAAMRPDRARVLTSELARLRGERVETERAATPRAERP